MRAIEFPKKATWVQTNEKCQKNENISAKMVMFPTDLTKLYQSDAKK